MDESNIVYRVVIPEPLEYIMVGKKKYYTTANIWYAGVNHWTRMKILESAKWFLHQYLKPCPILDNPPYSIVIQYCRSSDIDIDDKYFFWAKIIHDMLAPPAVKKKSMEKMEEGSYLSLSEANRKLVNDKSSYIDTIGCEYYPTEDHYMVLVIMKA